LNTNAPNRSDTVPTGRFGVRYAVNEAFYLRGAAYAGFRPATLNELHRPFRVGNDVTEANPLLKPEKLYGVEGGVGGDGPIHWSATAFYNVLKDPVTNVTLGVGPGTFPIAGFIPAGGTLRQRQNAGEVKAWGLEGEASGDLAETLSWRAAFAYTHARVHGGTSAPQLTGLRPAQTPQFTATAGFDWRPLAKLTVSGAARYVGAQYDDDQNVRRLAPGALLDMRAAWKLAAREEVYVAVDNVADAKVSVGKTADFVDSFSEPRTVRVGFSYRR
ncbi:MAG TPA: TonB-dependent receptor, partial [Phenylobacterium sp.]|nr:TonB-dependent receptor [Phenylobacterium sp.]